MIVTFAWPSTYHRTGGVVVMYQFANGLSRLGHEVHFVHGPAWPDRIERIEELDWFAFHHAIEHHIVDEIDDLSLPPGDVFLSPSASARQGLPATMIQGAYMLPEDMERSAYRSRGPKVCVSRWLVDIGRRYGVPDEQLWHVPLGMDHDLFRVETDLDARRYDVAIVHHTHPTKGWAAGFDALRVLHRRRPDLRVAVFGGERPGRALPDWADWYDYPRHDVLVDAVYNQARIFLQPSFKEGFGFTCIEAMACGAALVTTDNGGADEYAVHGETALVVPPGDVDAMVAAMDTLLIDDVRRMALARAGERHVRRFRWETGTKVLESHLLEYVADPERFQKAPSVEGETVTIWDG